MITAALMDVKQPIVHVMVEIKQRGKNQKRKHISGNLGLLGFRCKIEGDDDLVVVTQTTGKLLIVFLVDLFEPVSYAKF